MAEVWSQVAVVALVLWCLLAIAATAVRLPGTWMILGGGLLYGWWAGWVGVGGWVIAALVVSVLVAEGAELLASVVTARKAGGSKRAAWGGFIGAFLGMFLLSFLVPIPLVGTMVGALVGCFVGATIGELSARRKVAQGTKVGFFSALGFVIGMVAKMGIAAAMAGLLVGSVVLASLTDEAPAADGTAQVQAAQVHAAPD